LDRHPQAEAIKGTVLAFHKACVERDAVACLALYTPETRERVSPWFRDAGVFDVYGKSNQSLWCDPRDIEVRMVEIAPPHATVEAFMRVPPGQNPMRDHLQLSLATVRLKKLEGGWRIGSPLLSPPESSLQQRQAPPG